VCAIGLLGAPSCAQAATAIDLTAEAEATYYERMTSSLVRDIYDLEQLFVDTQYLYLEIAPPGATSFKQVGIPYAVPVDISGMPEEFRKGLITDTAFGVGVYEVTVEEDHDSKQVVFLNQQLQPIFAMPLPETYDPYAFLYVKHPRIEEYSSSRQQTLRTIYHPARVQAQFRLVPLEDLAPYLYNEAQVAESEEQARSLLDAETMLYGASGGEGGMLMSMESTGTLEIAFMQPWTNAMELTIKFASTDADHVAEVFRMAFHSLPSGTRPVCFWQ